MTKKELVQKIGTLEAEAGRLVGDLRAREMEVRRLDLALLETSKVVEELSKKAASWEKAHDNIFQMLETERAKGREAAAAVRAQCEQERRVAMEELVLKALRR